MIKQYVKEIVVTMLLLISLALCLPKLSGIWMPTMFMPSILFFLVLAFFLFAAIVWKERATDEREDAHRSRASRAAFLTGSAMLVFGIVMQALNETIDPWLVITLSAMVIVKTAARVYYMMKH